ncbi:MAG: RidA family protein [Roseibium sp.]|uniref:RidA family protein n=1 Tax=Roseibium sp. TaxID=1936156 RepID=UPI0026092070|nr:RidA family protein [Roseibium sp.]MCV0424892.1 RidA family protein [Roseibium sp.]
MLERYAPDSVRKVPQEYRDIYIHGTQISSPERLVCLSGQIGIGSDGSVGRSFKAQCEQAMDNVEALLAEAGMSNSDILRVTYFLTEQENIAELSQIRKTRWRSETPPAVTTLVVKALAAADLLVEIEVTAAT